MDVPNPSPAWHPKERLRVLASLATGLREFSRKGTVLRAAVVSDVTQRMVDVATRPAAFLEENRENALETVEETGRRWVKL